MILYLDTSAFIRLYVREAGHELVWPLSQKAQQTAAHLITYAEMRATLAKMLRMDRLTKTEVAAIKKVFESDWRRTVQIIPADAMIRRAGDLAERYNLRGYDSVHLAAAESLVIDHNHPVYFASFDDALNKAADALGLHTLGK
jgi:uncharacterized protein